MLGHAFTSFRRTSHHHAMNHRMTSHRKTSHRKTMIVSAAAGSRHRSCCLRGCRFRTLAAGGRRRSQLALVVGLGDERQTHGIHSRPQPKKDLLGFPLGLCMTPIRISQRSTNSHRHNRRRMGWRGRSCFPIDGCHYQFRMSSHSGSFLECSG